MSEKRKLQYKGFSVDGEAWYHGMPSFLKTNCGNSKPGTYLCNTYGIPFAYEVRPETVCQFTGMYDKQGKSIYDRDKVRGGGGEVGTVYWDEDRAQWWVSPDDTKPDAPLCDESKYIIVIGNVHDAQPEQPHE